MNRQRARFTIRPESGGNGSIHNRKGEAVGYLEEWTLFINGERVGDVDDYRDALSWAEKLLTPPE